MPLHRMPTIRRRRQETCGRIPPGPLRRVPARRLRAAVGFGMEPTFNRRAPFAFVSLGHAGSARCRTQATTTIRSRASGSNGSPSARPLARLVDRPCQCTRQYASLHSYVLLAPFTTVDSTRRSRLVPCVTAAGVARDQIRCVGVVADTFARKSVAAPEASPLGDPIGAQSRCRCHWFPFQRWRLPCGTHPGSGSCAQEMDLPAPRPGTSTPWGAIGTPPVGTTSSCLVLSEAEVKQVYACPGTPEYP
jgi:hypothetical protein